MNRANYEQKRRAVLGIKKYVPAGMGIILLILLILVAFILAFRRTIPLVPLEVDEGLLRSAVASVYSISASDAEDIVLEPISASRVLATSEDYYEYSFEYVRDNVCYTGILTVCYEYDGKKWIPVSVAVTELEEQYDIE